MGISAKLRQQILDLHLSGMTNAEIAWKLGIPIKVVEPVISWGIPWTLKRKEKKEKED